ncbi:MAG: DUF6265 family protein [Bacteroidales bacterium]
MRTLRTILLYSSILLFATNKLIAQTDGIEQFQWLIGNWKSTQTDGVFLESWSKYDDNTMTGRAYNIVKSDTLFSELLQIHRVGSFWVYIATIEPGYPTTFTLINADADKWIFVNYEHDFPQRVVYTKKEDGTLHAVVEGDMDGIQMSEEYLLSKY